MGIGLLDARDWLQLDARRMPGGFDGSLMIGCGLQNDVKSARFVRLFRLIRFLCRRLQNADQRF